MWSEKRLVEIENQLKQEGILRIDTDKKYAPNQVWEFLYDFLDDYNQNYHTYTSTGDFQCYSKKNRSMGDIYRICLNIFPDLTFKQLIKELHHPDWFNDFSFDSSNNNDYIVTLKCPDIKKTVFNLKRHFNFDCRGRKNFDKTDWQDEFGFINDDILQILKS
jgi:hypothetical protein